MYDTWLQTMRMNQKLIKQNSQFNKEKNKLLEKVRSLETKLAKDDDIQVELNQIKKSLKMLNFGSSKLDQILSLGKVAGDHAGLGYTGIRSYPKTIFVQATNSFNPQEAKKQKSEILNMKFEEKSLKRKWIPRCHYCNLLGHIRPHCFTYLADLRKMSNKNIHSYAIGMIKEEDKFGAQIKRVSMLKPIVLQKHDPMKMVNGTGYQTEKKRNGKFVKM